LRQASASAQLPSRPGAARLGPPHEPRFPEAKIRRSRRPPESSIPGGPERGDARLLALEALQVTGSFKVRGALVPWKPPHGHVVAASAGNHGAAGRYAGSVLGCRHGLRASHRPRASATNHQYGAELVVPPATTTTTQRRWPRSSARQGSAFVSPYDDWTWCWATGVLGLEIVRALGGVRARARAFGVAAWRRARWAMQARAGSVDRNVWGVQSEASCAMACRSSVGCRRAPRTGRTTLAEGLEGGIRRGFARARERWRGWSSPRGADRRGHGACAPQMGSWSRGARRRLSSVLFGSGSAARGDVLVVLTGRNVTRERLDGLSA